MLEKYKNPKIAIAERVEDLLRRMTISEKVGQCGQVFPRMKDPEELKQGLRDGRYGSRILAESAWSGNDEVRHEQELDEFNEFQRIAVAESRLGIPVIYGRDVIYGQDTVLPIPLAQAASWDPELIEAGYTCVAREAAAMGTHWTFSPMMDIARDPRWGRVIEGGGEDPYLTSRCAEAAVKGFQGYDVADPERILACAKHFCAYGRAEGGRDYDTAEVSEHTLHNVILPPFKAAVKAGVGSVMSSFNDLGGTPVSGSRELLQGWLKDEQGFDGFVVSDWGSVRDLGYFGVVDGDRGSAQRAFSAGVDMAMLSDAYDSTLEELVSTGEVDMERLDDAVRRILTAKFRLGLFENPYVDKERSKSVLRRSDHVATALKLAEEAIVLLKNDDHILPLPKQGRKITVIGPYAEARRQHLSSWCLDGRPEATTTIADGIKSCAPQADVVVGAQLFSDEMVENALNADLVVMCVGESHKRSGETKNISMLQLPPGQEEMIKAVGKTGTPMIVVICSGRPLPSPAAEQYAQAILFGWQCGTEAGQAIANILFGDAVPSGKLPITIPRHAGQIPIYYARKPLGKMRGVPDYRLYLDEQCSPLYRFGYGLSYTTFEYSDISVDRTPIPVDGKVVVSATITNTGACDGVEVAQCYIRDVVSSTTRPVRELKGFSRVKVKAGESLPVRFELGWDELAFYGADRCFQLEPGKFKVYIGGCSAATLETEFEVI